MQVDLVAALAAAQLARTRRWKWIRMRRLPLDPFFFFFFFLP
jgi:hypothetical protein